MAKKAAKKAAKRPPYRLKEITDDAMNTPQQALRDAIYSGPRGMRKKLTGPFQIWLNAPELGHLAQSLGAHCRYNTTLSPRLSETAILATGQFWKAQYEWHAHAPMAEKAGVKPQTINDIRAGRAPKRAAKDERAIVDFVRELYKTRRVSDRTYKRVHAFLGDTGMVELVGICGYYALISRRSTCSARSFPTTRRCRLRSRRSRAAIASGRVPVGRPAPYCQWLRWPDGAAPIASTLYSTSTVPAFSKVSVPLTVSPCFSGSFSAMNMRW